jgi:hypothetical protein
VTSFLDTQADDVRLLRIPRRRFIIAIIYLYHDTTSKDFPNLSVQGRKNIKEGRKDAKEGSAPRKSTEGRATTEGQKKKEGTIRSKEGRIPRKDEYQERKEGRKEGRIPRKEGRKDRTGRGKSGRKRVELPLHSKGVDDGIVNLALTGGNISARVLRSNQCGV